MHTADLERSSDCYFAVTFGCVPEQAGVRNDSLLVYCVAFDRKHA